MRNTEEPTSYVEEGPIGGTISTHPAFGQIAVSRVNGGHTSLYGSDFVHNSYIVIRIATSKLRRDLSHDWYFADSPFVEVALSEAQWATFVSAIGMGDGVPCTIQQRDRKLVPYISAPTDRQEQFQYEADERLRDGLDALKELDTMISESGLSGKKAAVLRAKLTTAVRELGANIGFVADSFAKHMEKTSESAKVEIHGYMNNVLHRAGLSALGDQMPLSITVDGEVDNV